MKQIINGKKYSTETAKKVGYYSSPFSGFDHYSETLYRKKTGEFFLFGEGGANSKYTRQIDMNTWSGDSRIIPMTEAEAKKWAERSLDADEYEAIFGEVEE